MAKKNRYKRLYPAILVASLLLAGCGGGSSSSSTTSPPPPASLSPPGAPLVRVSGPSPYPASCGGGMAGSVNYENAEVEPYVAVNPTNPSNLISESRAGRFWRRRRRTSVGNAAEGQ